MSCQIPVIKEIVFIGAGKLAAHLAKEFHQKELCISQIVSRSRERGVRLAEAVGGEYLSDISLISHSADICILTVTDTVIASVAQQFPHRDKLLVHTSGSVPMSVLQPFTDHPGVFYPLQTFPGDTSVNFSRVPVCIESGVPDDLIRLQELAALITGAVYALNSDDRRLAHLGAVFACNFSNFMYTIAGELLKTQDLPEGILNALILQTAKNAVTGSPAGNQTGPAMRNDGTVIGMHHQMLADYPDFDEIYSLITAKIMKYHKSHGQL